MTNKLDTDLNTKPYFDDFNHAEKENYIRILFKPHTPVQARELTQIQSILQNQIDKFGSNILVDGTIVNGGNFVEDKNIKYVKILDNNTNNQPVVLTQYLNRYAIGQVSGVKALIVSTEVGLETQMPDLNTLFVVYMTTSDSGNKVFSAGEVLNIIDEFGNKIDSVTVAGSETVPLGNSYGLRCGDGVIFQKGFFINFNNSLLIVSKYNNTPNNVVVGFDIQEKIIDSFEDTTLRDNSNGFSNYNAPGADRLQLIPKLVVIKKDEALKKQGFLILQEYENGKVVRKRTDTQFNSINKELARRTMEESGNYSIGEIPIQIEDSPDDPNELLVKIEKCLAYINGNRVEILDTISKAIEKPNDFQSEDNQNILTNIGHYVNVNNVAGVFDFTNFNQIQLLDNVIGSSGKVIGTANIRSFTKNSDNSYRIYLFNIQMKPEKQFNQVKAVSQENSTANLILESGVPAIKDYGFKQALFPAGRNFIKSFPPENTSYIGRTKTSGTIGKSSITINLSTGEFPFGNSITLNEDQKNQIIVFANGEPISLTNANATTSSDATSLTITFPDETNAGKSAVVFHDVKYQNVVASKKTLKTVYFKIDCATHESKNSGTYSLGVPDVFEILGIYLGENEDYNEKNPDIKDSFKLYSNQKDDYYGYSYITKNNSNSLDEKASLLIKARVFVKDNINSFFSVDSYPIDDTNKALNNTIKTEQIPNYTLENGQLIYLRDYIDFRPYVEPKVSYGESVATAGILKNSVQTDQNNVSFPNVAAKFCSPNQYVISSFQYYIGRQDRIMLMKNGEIEVVTGVASLLPTVPSEIDGGMTIATIYIPPYPALSYSYAQRIGKKDYGIVINKIKNRGFTMRDISKIDTNLKNMVYYTTLNALEKSADDMVITDSQGLDRFKNGIIVDNFSNLVIADTNNEEFSAGIDRAYEEIMPQFRTYPIDVEIESMDSVVSRGKAATLPFNEKVLISQLTATKWRSCTSGFYSYTGTALLYPEYDSEPDVTTAPDINIDNDLNSVFADYTEALNQIIPLTTQSTDVTSSQQSSRRYGKNGYYTDTTTTNNYTQTVKNFAQNNGSTNTKKVGDFVTDTNFNPWLRSRDVNIYVYGMRPNTQVWFWFDKQEITKYVNPANGFSPETLQRSSNSNVIKTDENGILKAIFKIPANTFKVGDRLLEIYDTNLYNSKDDCTTSATKTYSGWNFSYTKTGVTTTTRTPSFDSTTTVNKWTTVNNSTRWTQTSDPISMTFFVDKNKSSDTDVFVSSVDVYFAKKGTNGVRVQLRETANGYPANIVLPFSEVVLPSDFVNVSDDSSIATRVNFTEPVALKTDTEYSLTIIPIANDPNYRVWVSQTGQKDLLSGGVITEDVSGGTLFTSTNSSAWTAYQNENLKFAINVCDFTANQGVLRLKPRNYEFLSINNITGNFAIDELVYQEKDYDNGTVNLSNTSNVINGVGTNFTNLLTVGDYIIVSTDNNTVEALKVISIVNNTQITVENPPMTTKNNVKYFCSQVGKVNYFNKHFPARLHLKNSNARTDKLFTKNTAIIGVESKARANIVEVENQKISYLQSHIYKTNFSKTRTLLKYSVQGDDYNAEFEDNLYLNQTPKYLYSKSNIIRENRKDDFFIDITLQNTSATTRDTSPFIDYDISTFQIYEYLLNKGETANYVTHSIQLSDELDAEDFRIYLTNYRPTGTDVEVYVKFLSGTDPTPLNQVPWTKLDVKSENTFFSSNSNRFDYKEFEYSLPQNSVDDGACVENDRIKYISKNGSIYTNFKFFVIKITMKAESFYRVPRVADMRGIALS